MIRSPLFSSKTTNIMRWWKKGNNWNSKISWLLFGTPLWFRKTSFRTTKIDLFRLNPNNPVVSRSLVPVTPRIFLFDVISRHIKLSDKYKNLKKIKLVNRIWSKLGFVVH